MALVGKAAGKRDLGQRGRAVAKQAFGPLNPLLHEPAMRRHPDASPEGPAELRGGQAASRGQIGQAQCAAHVGHQQFLRAPLHQRTEPADLWQSLGRHPAIGRGDMMSYRKHEVIHEHGAHALGMAERR